jgi:hypothetical protein
MATKCTIKNGTHVEPCDTLREMTEGPSAVGRARGVYVWPLVNMNTMKPTRTMFGIKSSAQPKGLIINFCPWCGADHRAAQPPEESATKEPK